MTYSVQKSTAAKVTLVTLTLLLAACSSDQRYKRQVSGDESYLQATPLAELHAPAGLILPLENGAYTLPTTSSQGAIGKALDIRPPAQPLALDSGGRATFTGDTVTLLIEANQESGLWSQLVNIIQQNHYPVTQRDDQGQQLTTDWIQWNRADEDQQYRGRYKVRVAPQGYQQAVIITLLDLEQAGKPVTDPSARQRYSAQMMNTLSAGLDQADLRRQASQAQSGVQHMDVQSAADDTGLPMLVVRGPFNTVWAKLPAALAKVGMKVTDSTRAKGSINITYKPVSDSTWSELGVHDPDLASGDYKLQIGDLGNRTSMQFIDPKGHTLTQSQNDALVAVFQAALNK